MKVKVINAHMNHIINTEDEWDKLKQSGSARNKYTRNEFINHPSGVTEIYLYNMGNVAVGSCFIDTDEVDKIKHLKLCRNVLGYVVTWENGKLQYLHHIILGHEPNHFTVVDHINGLPFDNRKINLRVVSKSVNALNSNKNLGKTSEHRGIYYDKAKKKWCARLSLEGKQILFKRFNTEAEALAKYTSIKKEVMNEYKK